MTRPSGQFHLLTKRTFLPFFVAQALGALNDNLYKNVLVILATYHAARYGWQDIGLLTNLAAGLFILPFMLFSGLAGQLADKFDKVLVIRAVKLCEVLIMIVAATGFIAQSMTVLLGALFLMGMHATFFAPAKYGLLPETLATEDLLGGNALLETGTFVAILLGTLGAGLVAGIDRPWLVAASLVLVAIAGLVAGYRVPRLAPMAPTLSIDWNPVRSAVDNVREAARTPSVMLAILGISWFWFYGVVMLAHMPLYAAGPLHGTEGVVTALLIGFSVGVGTGSLACERLSRGRLELGLVPIGGLGLTLFAVDLYFATPSVLTVAAQNAAIFTSSFQGLRILADVALIGAAGGLYIVPLYALVNRDSPADRRSRIISANSICNAFFMVAGSLFGALMLRYGTRIQTLLLWCGILNAGVVGIALIRTPVFWRGGHRWGSRR